MMKFLIFLLAISFVLAEPVFEYNETDFVNLSVNAVDPDGDDLSIRFGDPLSDDGTWQTQQGDVGEYRVLVAVSDGKDVSEKEIILIIKDLNAVPTITHPDIVLYEGDVVRLTPEVIDIDDDDVSVSISAPVGDDGEWQTDFSSAGFYEVEIIATDGKTEVSEIVTIEIKDVNQPPVAWLQVPSIVKEGDTVEFSGSCSDYDGDSLDVKWYLNDDEISNEENFTYFIDYSMSGNHTIKFVVDDGKNQTILLRSMYVINVNRAPDISELEVITVMEGEQVIFSPQKKDSDGDVLNVKIDGPFTGFVWNTTYNDSGSYEFDVIYSDGELTVTKKLKVVVRDVNRLPVFDEHKVYLITEGQMISFEVNVNDPDGDQVHITPVSIPDGASFDGKTFLFSPGYDFVWRDTPFLRFLNMLRIDQYLMKRERLFFLEFMACDEDCVSTTIQLKVMDKNRKPVISPFETVTIDETNSIKLHPTAVDPDGDYVSYYFTSPLHGGKWNTDYDDAGIYKIIVGATDGLDYAETEVEIIVENKNRLPIIKGYEEAVLFEGDTFGYALDPWDADNDSLYLYMEESPNGAKLEGWNFTWIVREEVNGNHTFISNLIAKSDLLSRYLSKERKTLRVVFAVSDGNATVKQEVYYEVVNNNSLPVITAVTEQGIRVYAGEQVTFTVLVQDDDGDELTYTWDFGLTQESFEGDYPSVKRTFTVPGRKQVSVVISDGRESVEYSWVVDVMKRPVHNYAVPVEQTFKVIYIG